jgi:hypothetical protein
MLTKHALNPFNDKGLTEFLQESKSLAKSKIDRETDFDKTYLLLADIALETSSYTQKARLSSISLSFTTDLEHSMEQLETSSPSPSLPSDTGTLQKTPQHRNAREYRTQNSYNHACNMILVATRERDAGPRIPMTDLNPHESHTLLLYEKLSFLITLKHHRYLQAPNLDSNGSSSLSGIQQTF